jgi:hypothetical protein
MSHKLDATLNAPPPKMHLINTPSGVQASASQYHLIPIGMLFPILKKSRHVGKVKAVDSMGLNQPKALNSSSSVIQAEINCCPG